MITVSVELHSAITGQKTELARMMIDNVGGNHQRGDYGCRTYRGRSEQDLDMAQIRDTATRRGEVKGHRRLSLHVWHLVAKALRTMDYGE